MLVLDNEYSLRKVVEVPCHILSLLLLPCETILLSFAGESLIT